MATIDSILTARYFTLGLVCTTLLVLSQGNQDSMDHHKCRQMYWCFVVQL